MARTLSEENTAFADELERHLDARTLVKALIVLRAKAELSQEDLAGKLNCTQSKISKLEASSDADIKFGDLVRYTGGVGHEMRLFLVPKGLTIVDEVKLHAFVIRRLLGRLVEIVGDDRSLARGVEQFLVEASFNLGRFVQSAADALPPLSEEEARPLQVEAPEMEDCPPARTRFKRSQQATATQGE